MIYKQITLEDTYNWIHKAWKLHGWWVHEQSQFNNEWMRLKFVEQCTKKGDVLILTETCTLRMLRHIMKHGTRWS